MIASRIPVSFIDDLSKSWLLFITGTVWAMAAAAILGWFLTRLKVLPGSTAVWGLSPGGAGIMTLMSEQYGADIRLVAFMQYLRVVFVAIAATFISGFWITGVPMPQTNWLPPVNWPAFGLTMFIGVIGVFISGLVRFPSGAVLFPLILGVIAEQTVWLSLELPPLFLVLVYGAIGWSIGLRFTRSLLGYAARALPLVLTATISLMVICGLFAWILVVFAGLDPLTAYLATSPGGLDTIAIIAATSSANLPFVMTMHTARMLLVITTGPALAKFIVRRSSL
jgi:membrane AbrB-like protein